MKRERGFGLLAYLIAAGVVLALLAGIAWKVREAGYQAAKLECEEAARQQREAEAAKVAKADSEKEKGDAKAKVVYRTITRDVDRIVERPVYRNVCLDADGLHSVNAALRGTLPDPGEPHRAVPRFSTAR